MDSKRKHAKKTHGHHADKLKKNKTASSLSLGTEISHAFSEVKAIKHIGKKHHKKHHSHHSHHSNKSCHSPKREIVEVKLKKKKQKPLKKVCFFNNPLTSVWTFADREVILFEKTVKLSKAKCFNVDALISAEIGGSGNVVYRLYVDGCQVTQAGFEPDAVDYEANLGSVSLNWGGCFPCDSCVNVKLTAQLNFDIVNTFNENDPITANVDNNISQFQGAKCATLRITFL